MKSIIGVVAVALLALAGCDNDRTTANPADRDNTAVNERDADGVTVTPFDQSDTEADTELVAKLRAEVLEIDDLSINGRNVKIVTNNGRVVLRGPVNSGSELDAIVAVVNGIAGESNVTNALEVETE